MLKTGDEKFYDGLLMSDVARNLLKFNKKEFIACCNGVGSPNGFWGKLTYHFIPQTIWGLPIRAAADIHDVEYTYPDNFYCKKAALKWKVEADKRFKYNIMRLIKKNTKWKWLKKIRYIRAKEYYWILKKFGEESFLANKSFTKKF